jgi:hypothetical protein
LRKPSRHPAWRDVNLAGTIRGWQRFSAAQEWIDRNIKKTAEPTFAPAAAPPRNQADEALFQEFVKFRQQRR